MQYFEKNSRALDYIAAKEQKNHVITKYLLEQELTFKMIPFEKKAIIKKYMSEEERVVVRIPEGMDEASEKHISFFKILAKYIELDCMLLQKIEKDLYLFKVERLAIAKKSRESLRVPVPNGKTFVTNIVSSKTVIDANMFTVPTLVKVNFDDYKNRLKKNSQDSIVIDAFKPGLDRKFELAKRTRKSLLIEDTQDPSCYTSNEPDRMNYSKDIDDDVPSAIRKFKDQKIVSELIRPIIYKNHADELIPIGYIWIQSRDKKLTSEYLAELGRLSKEVVDRIKESNTIKTTEKFTVLDASAQGIKVKIHDPNLVETLPKQEEFVFDVLFKMQAPLTVFGIVRWWGKDADNQLFMGLEFKSKSDNPGERERYIKNLELMSKGAL
ncbi:DUF1577 domain-containing protein [Leptospira langatensis]|uniref:DUF1577 domain-containing protein n=1 Tax=Leptospira langatensis TaxID=2484983 RepID=A0A5F1ZRN6_9LEPT|nr:DUF1577 domain-containing protein [Leptospira langatensis]TGJ98984.1 DUF1577 domain-containing protein [Leptospira langatensis]TGL40448.1 DUF1577 domain-containing protein [Leptospira langatensis]